MSGKITDGLTLDILRGSYDSTLNRITSRALGIGAVTIVGTVHGRSAVVPLPADSRVVSARDDHPAVALASNLAGTAYLAPVELDADGHYVRTSRGMAGGAYAATSDSRISALVAAYIGAERFYGALSIHDRFES